MLLESSNGTNTQNTRQLRDTKASYFQNNM